MNSSERRPGRGRSTEETLREALASAIDLRISQEAEFPGGQRGATLNGRLLQFIAASFPAVIIGILSLGGFATGLSYFLPLLTVAVVVSLTWEVVFARMLDRPTDAGWLMTAWLFVALLPPGIPLLVAAFCLSFGVVLGCHIFGGSGRYLVSPALLGAVFVNIGYPSLFTADVWRQSFDAVPAWVSIAEGGATGLADSGIAWLPTFAGAEVGVFGAPSALLCLLGAFYLAWRGLASWRTVAGGIIGVLLSAAVLGATAESGSLVPAHWHLATGSFAFGLAFIATDPTTMPLTKLARWIHGGLVGALVVVIRVASPAHPEATLNALLLASLCIPLLDHIVVAARIHAMRRAPRQ